jgi:hypothetical protein
VLDELGALIRAGRVRKPSGLLYRLIERAKVGQFAPNWSVGPVVSKAASEEPRENTRDAASLSPQMLFHHGPPRFETESNRAAPREVFSGSRAVVRWQSSSQLHIERIGET